MAYGKSKGKAGQNSPAAVMGEQQSLCAQQGVGTIEGKSGGNAEGVGDPPAHMGHGAGQDSGVAGNYMPGGGKGPKTQH